MKKNIYRFLPLILFVLFVAAFCYFRVRPIYFQTIPFTFDQGRDFLKVADIVANRNLAFIGPTTGIGGLYHGVWWYYFLAGAFIVFHGWPAGYYLAAVLLQLAVFIVFSLFIKRYFGWTVALILAGLITTSSYFMSTSSVIANNVLAIPFLVLFLVSNFYLLATVIPNKKVFVLLIGLSLGFITESEVAFGVLLIPVYLLIVLLFKELRQNFKKKENVKRLVLGFIIPVIPRILFEIRNGFPEVRAIGRFFLQNRLHTPKQYSSILQDRYNTFFEYYRSIFADNLLLFAFTASFFILILLLLAFGERKKQTNAPRLFFVFLTSIVLSLFFISTLYRDTFWSYYLEGIQYIFLILFAYLLSVKIKGREYVTNTIRIVILGLISYSMISMIIADYKKPASLDGLLVQQKVVDYITFQEKNTLKNYCVKIYTPPVIPHTYNYLFAYNKLSKGIPEPAGDWVQDKCWYVIEDDIAGRKDDWVHKNIPAGATMIKETIVKDIRVQLWKK